MPAGVDPQTREPWAAGGTMSLQEVETPCPQESRGDTGVLLGDLIHRDLFVGNTRLRPGRSLGNDGNLHM